MNDTALSNSAARTSSPAAQPAPGPLSRWNPVSVSIIVLAWLILHIGGLFSPGLLDDVDSIYIEIAREMLARHDFVTPWIDGIRFFDKPPLMYWLAAASMHLFGAHAWAARLPLALLTLGLFFATYALGLRLFAELSPRTHPDRGALYSVLALATCIGPYLYTRFFIPDILLTLWMTLGVHLFLIALDRARNPAAKEAPKLSGSLAYQPGLSGRSRIPHIARLEAHRAHTLDPTSSPLLPMLAFAGVMALNVLTKGLIGLVFPLGVVLFYLVLTRQLRLLPRLHPVLSTLAFLALAAPWHILAALRNPAISLPPGLGLPARGGWAWFYLYNEHIARFLSRRIPHDYGQVPIPLFWLLAAVWLIPWAAFLPAAIARLFRDLRSRNSASPCAREAAIALLLWSALVLGFFTLSARQEYYSLPAIPAFALMIGGLLAVADRDRNSPLAPWRHRTLRSSLFLLVPVSSLLAVVAAYFAISAPTPPPGTDISALLVQGPSGYNLSLGHLFDLTTAAMGLFRAPLALLSLTMLVIGPVTYLLRRSGRTFPANLTLAAAATALLLCVHEGLSRFYPILGSKSLADAIVTEQHLHPRAEDLILIDGELTAGSTLLFYTQQPVRLVEGRVNGLWYGSFWPDAPPIFETNASLHQLWSSPRRIFLLTDRPSARSADLTPYAPIHTLSSAGGKSILTNRP
ncbi:MAG: hypothetical protein NVSMB3_04750 [Acidobacteriaceae bacterium]